MASSYAPRPTLADIDLPPRRRLRDGTRSSGSSSSSSSVASSRGTGRGRKARTRAGSAFSTLSSVTSSTMGERVRGRSGVRRSTRSRPSQSRSVDIDDEPSFTAAANDDWDLGADYLPIDDRVDHAANENMASDISSRVAENEQTSDFVNMLRAMDETQPTTGLEGYSPPGQVATSSSSSSSSTSAPGNGTGAHRAGAGGRRFTAAEKGKGRAVPAEPITISDEDEEDGDDVPQVVGFKRKIHSVDGDASEEGGDAEAAIVGDEEPVGVNSGEDAEEEAEETANRLGEYTCPVCFSEPTQAVMTVCGHILCAECLHSSLLAAIARQPNPHPHNQPPPRKPPRRSKKAQAQPQPTAWTADQLREVWLSKRERAYELEARAAGMDDASIEAGREPVAPEELAVQMVLKGLWKVEERYWVIEGDCPVCRKGLPGGYGPPGKGIGGVIPLQVRVGGGQPR